MRSPAHQRGVRRYGRIVTINGGGRLMHLEENRFALYREAQMLLAGNGAAAGHKREAA
jgi:hypothetical protein